MTVLGSRRTHRLSPTASTLTTFSLPAAAALTQAAVAARGRGVGQADALRRSMLDLMQKPGMAHPMVWAPFVVVGDGR